MIKVLHVLDHSLPEQSGYSYRSHAVLCELTRLGVGVEAVTSPKQERSSLLHDVIDGVNYHRTAIRGATEGFLGQWRTITGCRAHIARYLRSHDIDIIHAHSPCLNGLAAFCHGVPIVYEMRSSWEDAAVSIGRTSEGTIRYRLSRSLETLTVKYAGEVVVICDGLKRDLIARGVSGGKITVVPNALPATMLEEASNSDVEAVKNRLGLHGKSVIGFFGTFFEWEGLETLIRSMPFIVEQQPSSQIVLAGSGTHEEYLRNLVHSLRLSESVLFVGRVGQDQIRALYGAADVMVYPRVASRLTDMVTPLKPLEAMAQLRPVVASDVGGHRELIEDGNTGILFTAGDPSALASRILQVLNDNAGSIAMAARAREFVLRERRWSTVVARYLPVYERLLGIRTIDPDGQSVM